MVRPRSAAAGPCWAARPSARSDPLKRRAQLPRSLFVADNDCRLCAKSLKASIACSPRSARQAASASRKLVRLTLPSSGLANGQPLKANVRQMQNTALMQRLARFPVAVGSPAERGGKSVPGCSPFGSQRSVAAPRSIAAFLVRGGQRLSVVRHEFQGQHCLSPTFGAASSVCLSQPRAPNPAFERTGQRPAAQGQR